MNDLRKQAREIAARHGIKAYEPPAETGKQEPGCECRVRKALVFVKSWLTKMENATGEDDPLAAMRRSFHSPVHARIDAALSAPCSCEQLRGDLDQLQSRCDWLRESIQEDHDEFYAGCAERANAVCKERDAAIDERDHLRTELTDLRLATTTALAAVLRAGIRTPVEGEKP